MLSWPPCKMLQDCQCGLRSRVGLHAAGSQPGEGIFGWQAADGRCKEVGQAS